MTLLCDTTQKRDVALSIAAHSSEILGPISRQLVEQVIPMIRSASQASRPGLAVGILLVFCNGMCTAKRFHVDNEEQTCRVGRIDEPDCLSHYNRCPLLMGIIDAFVYARNFHSHKKNNPRKFEDFMEGRISLLTAITPLCAHAYQTLNLARRPLDILHQRFRLPSVKAQYQNLPNNRITTRENGDDFKGWAFFKLKG